MLDAIHNVINAISGVLYQPYIVPLLLFATGVWFTVRTKGIQVRLFREACSVIMEKPGNKGGISSFGALMVSTASRVGTGNIIGVSTALCLGGPGAIFWMWIVALLGASTAFVESTLAQQYKFKHDGIWRGGPFAYISQGLNCKWLAVAFAIVTILGSGLFCTTVQGPASTTVTGTRRPSAVKTCVMPSFSATSEISSSSLRLSSSFMEWSSFSIWSSSLFLFAGSLMGRTFS